MIVITLTSELACDSFREARAADFQSQALPKPPY